MSFKAPEAKKKRNAQTQEQERQTERERERERGCREGCDHEMKENRNLGKERRGMVVEEKEEEG